MEATTSFTAPQWLRYHQSKLANICFTNALADRLDKQGSKIIATVAHPGLASTELQVTTTKAGGVHEGAMNVFMGPAQSAGDGACGILCCAFVADVKTREFWGPQARTGAAVRDCWTTEELDKDSNKDILWKASVEACGGDIF
jgi:NAD(P)-dependent dehydrogenase (short-subunit alcohol dehydrogenase family)